MVMGISMEDYLSTVVGGYHFEGGRLLVLDGGVQRRIGDGVWHFDGGGFGDGVGGGHVDGE